MRADIAALRGRGTTRITERIAASLGGGLADGTGITFEPGVDVNRGGVLLSLPALLANGLLRNVKKLFKIPQGFYQITSFFILLAFAVLLRIKSIEKLSGESPGELGKLLGLDRSPEIKTIRKKLSIISEYQNAGRWQKDLSEFWLSEQKELSGVLYIDGHVRVYYGKKAKLPKHYVARERLCLPGTIDYWVNDCRGQPFFYVSSEINAGIIKVIREEIVPQLKKSVPQPAEKELEHNKYIARFSIIFDREGYSPKLFKEMWEKHRISCYTYKKYVSEKWYHREFIEQSYVTDYGEKVCMKLAERGIYYRNEKFWVREIRKLSASGHQTSLITTDFSNDAVTIARRMFNRWVQENFFRYMRENFNIDRVLEFGIKGIDETKKVKNPAYTTLEKDIKSLNGKLTQKLRIFAQLSLKDIGPNEIMSKKIDGIDKLKVFDEIEDLTQRIIDLKAVKSKTDKHIEIAQLPPPLKYTGLLKERKHIIDLIKMIAYRAETSMASIIIEKMRKPKEAKSFLQKIFQTEIDLKVDEDNNTLLVMLHNLYSQSYDQVAEYLCEKLNETDTIYPGTNLRLVFKLGSN